MVNPLAYTAGVHTPVVHTPVVHTPTVGVKTQYHVSDIVGQSAYGHIEPGQTHTAVQDGAGNKVGSFSYVKPDGMISHTKYVADSLGYRVASNDLPVGPAVHHLSVLDTPEVHAAKVAHLAEVERIKLSRARRQVFTTLPGSTSPLFHHSLVHHTPLIHTPVVHPVVHHGYSHHVPADTPEVHAAKVAHFIEHAKVSMRTKRAVLTTPLAYSTPHHYPVMSYSHHLPYSTTYSALHPYVHNYNHHVVV